MQHTFYDEISLSVCQMLLVKYRGNTTFDKNVNSLNCLVIIVYYILYHLLRSPVIWQAMLHSQGSPGISNSHAAQLYRLSWPSTHDNMTKPKTAHNVCFLITTHVVVTSSEMNLT